MLLILVNSFAIIGVIVLGVALYQQSERASIAEAAAAIEAEQRDVEAAERGEAIEALRDQVLELGEEPVVDPRARVDESDRDQRQGWQGR